MMNLAEYRRSNTRLADFLPWCALVDEGIVLNKDGSFQRTARFRGPDLDSAVPAELVAIAGRFEQCAPASRIRLGSLCRSPAPLCGSISTRHLSGRGIRSRRRRATSTVRGSRRALRIELLPDISLSTAGGGHRESRTAALRRQQPHCRFRCT